MVPRRRCRSDRRAASAWRSPTEEKAPPPRGVSSAVDDPSISGKSADRWRRRGRKDDARWPSVHCRRKSLRHSDRRLRAAASARKDAASLCRLAYRLQLTHLRLVETSVLISFGSDPRCPGISRRDSGVAPLSMIRAIGTTLRLRHRQQKCAIPAAHDGRTHVTARDPPPKREMFFGTNEGERTMSEHGPRRREEKSGTPGSAEYVKKRR